MEPIFSFDEKKGPFFRIILSYGCMNSVKEIVMTLHTHRTKVLLDIVSTDSVEGVDASCLSVSFQGIDNASVSVDFNHAFYFFSLSISIPIFSPHL